MWIVFQTYSLRQKYPANNVLLWYFHIAKIKFSLWWVKVMQLSTYFHYTVVWFENIEIVTTWQVSILIPGLAVSLLSEHEFIVICNDEFVVNYSYGIFWDKFINFSWSEIMFEARQSFVQQIFGAYTLKLAPYSCSVRLHLD